MSKALRVVTENFPSPALEVPHWKTLHPFYMTMSGSPNPPCYVEFMKFAECMSHKEKASKCTQELSAVMACLHRYGEGVKT